MDSVTVIVQVMAVISVVRAKKTSADKPLPKSTLLLLALIRGVRVELIA